MLEPNLQREIKKIEQPKVHDVIKEADLAGDFTDSHKLDDGTVLGALWDDGKQVTVGAYRDVPSLNNHIGKLDLEFDLKEQRAEIVEPGHMINKHYEGYGIEEEMVKFAEDYASKKNIKEVTGRLWLMDARTAEERNRLCKFWKKQGYEVKRWDSSDAYTEEQAVGKDFAEIRKDLSKLSYEKSLAWGSEIPRSKDLPESISLGRDLEAKSNDLWNRGTKEAESPKEWACTIIHNENRELKCISELEGTKGQVEPIRGISEAEIGTFHTHPYTPKEWDLREGGIAFSPADFKYFIESGDKIQAVRSGADVFVFVRTEKTPQTVDFELKREITDWDSISKEWVWRCNSPQNVAAAMNLHLCEKYGVAFYHGSADQDLKLVYKP